MPTEEQGMTVLTLKIGSRPFAPELPAGFRPMHWSEIRQIAARGVEFRPQTVSHPLLGRTNGARSAAEIIGSWRYLGMELPVAIPTFCYPGGMPREFGVRVRALVAAGRMIAAIAASGSLLTAVQFSRDRFALPRVGSDSDPERFLQTLHDIDHLRDRARHQPFREILR